MSFSAHTFYSILKCKQKKTNALKVTETIKLPWSENAIIYDIQYHIVRKWCTIFRAKKNLVLRTMNILVRMSVSSKSNLKNHFQLGVRLSRDFGTALGELLTKVEDVRKCVEDERSVRIIFN